MDRGGPDAVGELIAAAGTLLDPEALALLTVRHVRDITGAHGAELYWWDEAEQVLTPLALLDRSKREPDPHVHRGQGMVGAVFADGRERVVRDYGAELPHPISWSRTRAAAGVPLLVGGEPRGVLTAIHQEPRDFEESSLTLMRLLATQLGPALMNMRLLAQAQRRAAEARALAELMRRGSAAFEPDDVFELIAMYGCRLLGADFAGVGLADPDGRATAWVGVYGTCSERWRELTYGPSSYIAREVFPSADPIISGDHRSPPGRSPSCTARTRRAGCRCSCG